MSRSGNRSVAFIPSSRRPGFFGMADFSRTAPAGEVGLAPLEADLGSAVIGVQSRRSIGERPSGTPTAPRRRRHRSIREQGGEVLEVRLPVAEMVIAQGIVAVGPAGMLEADPRSPAIERFDGPADHRLLARIG